MTPILPFHESVSEKLRNALMILDTADDLDYGGGERAYKIVKDALAQLSEPSPACVAAVRRIVETHSPLMTQHESPADMDRYWRDSASVILKAQVEGALPVARATIVSEEQP